jgi:peptidoglycan hydrolase-like protein with peptidoglycan-binding domain
LAYLLNLPDNPPCEQDTLDTESLYTCDGVLYRPTVYQNENVYEIVSSEDESSGSSAPSITGPLRLTSPPMRGEAVYEVQQKLTGLGYDVGGVDGVFGPGTASAVGHFQRSNGLVDNGVVTDETAAALGL